MVINRMIERYVNEVGKHVPFWRRREIKNAVRQTIMEMLALICEGEKPTVRDVRCVFEDMGRPARVARDFLENAQKKRRKIRRYAAVAANSAIKVLSVVALVMVVVGLLLLVVGISHNLVLFGCGAIIGAVVMIVKTFGPLGDNREEDPGAEIMRSYLR